MKKLSIIVSVMMIMALAVPAFAAELDLGGKTVLRSVYGEDAAGNYAFQGDGEVDIDLKLNTDNDAITGGATYRLRIGSPTQLGSTGFSGTAGQDLLEAWIQTEGAFVPGMPEVTTKLGRFSTNQNTWVGNFGRRDAVLVSDMNLGAASLNLYHGWPNTTDTIAAVSGSANVDVVELGGIVVSHGPAASKSLDYAVSAGVNPAEGVGVDVEYASDGVNNDTAWKLSGELATIENFDLNAAVWSTGQNFMPTYRSNASKEDLEMDRTWTSRPSAWGDAWIQSGFSVGASTTQGGLPLDVTYKSGTIFNNGSVAAQYQAQNMMSFGVGTTLAEIDTDVIYTKVANDDAVIDVIGSKTLPVSALGADLDLTGRVRMQGGNTNFATDAIWTAPNGIVLGLHYANYDRVMDWNHNFSNANLSEGLDIGQTGQADGFAVTAGYSLGF